MSVYILFYLFTFIFAVLHQHNFILLKNRKIFFYKSIFIFILSIYIGLRDTIGGDWGTYYANYFLPKIDLSLNNYFKIYIFTKDPLFHLINYIVAITYPSYYLVNFIFAIIFSFCLVQFSFSLEKPFFAILISTPVLITVVAMGFHRQALSIAFFMIGLIYLNKNNLIKYSFYVLIGCLFHYTAVFLFFFGLFTKKKINIKNLIILSFLFFLIIFSFIGFDIVIISLGHYLDAYNSAGAYLRVFMSIVPCLIFLIFSRNYFFNYNNNLLKGFSYFAFALLLLLLFINSSAMIDRFAIYLIPIQMIIWVNFIDIFEKKTNSNNFIFYIIGFVYFLALIVWIHFGDYSMWWLPYKNVIITYLLNFFN